MCSWPFESERVWRGRNQPDSRPTSSEIISEMKTVRSHIFRLPASDFRPGVCGVCGRVVMIRFRDASSGFQLGDCCVNTVIGAERLLSSAKGLRHPTLEETTR